MKKDPRQDLTEGNALVSLIKFSSPLVLANLLQTLYNMTDMVIAGRYAGPAAMSAVSAGGQFAFFLTALSIGIGAGGQIILSQLKGAGDNQGLRETAGTFLTMSLLAGIAAGAAGLVLCKPVLRLLDTPAEAFDQAMDYMRVTSAGIPFTFGYNGIAALLRGVGDSRRPLLFILAAFLVSLVLNYIFVPVLGMGAAGTALATAISQALAFGLSAAHMFRKRDAYGLTLRLRDFRMKRDRLSKLLKVGLPFGIQMSVTNLANMFIIAGVNQYGVAASAAMGAGTRMTQLCTVPVMAVGNGASAMVGQSMGAGKERRASATVHSALLIMLLLTAGTLLITQIFPEHFIRLFQGDPKIAEIGAAYLRTVSWCYPGYAIHSAYNAAVLGVGFTAFSMFAAGAEALFGRVVMTWAFGTLWGLGGIFAAQGIAPYISAVILCAYFYSGRWRRREPLA